ncbi:hypothetical protein D3C78_1053090 [compost metagenome]
MEAQAALVRADGAAHLDAVAAVDLHLALVIDPGHAEQHGALGLDHALQNAGLQVMRVGLEEWPQAAQHFFHSLVEFRLGRVALLQAREEIVDRFDHGRHLTKRIGLIGFFQECTKKQSHRNRAKCRFFEIIWCVFYNCIQIRYQCWPLRG